MYFTNFDAESITDTKLTAGTKRLLNYRATIAEAPVTRPEYALMHPKEPELHDALSEVAARYKKKTKHVLLIGIGGSSLGTEAVHEALTDGTGPELSVLDTVSGPRLEHVLARLTRYKRASDVVICAISKSGSTTETMSNLGVVADRLEKHFGSAVREQFIYIGDPETDFLKAGKRRGGMTLAMPAAIGGRYSVATVVGLVPLILLGYEVDEYIAGFLAANEPEFATVAEGGAARIALYTKAGYRHLNFFAFEPQLQALGAWYRQLFAESLGKEHDRQGRVVTKGMLPTISTPVELHSVGQLYLSGFPGVYTDFVTFAEAPPDPKIPATPFTKPLKGKTIGEVATALYGGVIGAYEERGLPHRTTIFDEESRAYALGCFMGLRMREVICAAELLDRNAFDQPNVELYKSKSKEILGI